MSEQDPTDHNRSEGSDLRYLEECIRTAKRDLRIAVRAKRQAGWSWARIGRALGVSRQAAWERFRRWVA